MPVNGWLLIGVILLPFTFLGISIMFVVTAASVQRHFDDKRDVVDDAGRRLHRDTPRSRARQAKAWDRLIAMERRGPRRGDGPGDDRSWVDFWSDMIQHTVRDTMQNPGWHENYIRTRRRAAGLPELADPDAPNPDTTDSPSSEEGGDFGSPPP
ncbi:hypothetical protein [Zhihengliuella sp. ISTPL4]|uniref:hypothetical protein n=1 Tax=Zhihengliuella sp. ISTPL4 TaxID=2058657 RepID=UPI001305373F|nr:hypothetical protein [Zhihengliuella sp. ISTPL4]